MRNNDNKDDIDTLTAKTATTRNTTDNHHRRNKRNKSKHKETDRKRRTRRGQNRNESALNHDKKIQVHYRNGHKDRKINIRTARYRKHNHKEKRELTCVK